MVVVMEKLYNKSELLFSLVMIAVYVAGSGLSDALSELIGVPKSATFLFHVAFSAVLLIWLKKNGLFGKYGLCRMSSKASRFLFFIPLAVASSTNLWFGLKLNMPLTESLLFAGSMLFVGFLEEIIFRGLLFRAMAKGGIRSAVIVSSVTFGTGHIVNLFNGSGMDLAENLCQVVYAVAFGFVFVLIFHKGGSLIPCILSHSAVNVLSVFADADDVGKWTNMGITVILCVFVFAYCAVIFRLAGQVKDDQDRA